MTEKQENIKTAEYAEEISEAVERVMNLHKEINAGFDPLKYMDINTEICRRILFGYITGSILSSAKEDDKIFFSKDSCFIVNNGKIHKRIYIPEEYLRLFEEIYGAEFNGRAFFSVMEGVRKQLCGDENLGKLVLRVKEQDLVRESSLVESVINIY